MTVKELIEILKQVDGDLAVVRQNNCLTCREYQQEYVDEAYEMASLNNPKERVILID